MWQFKFNTRMIKLQFFEFPPISFPTNLTSNYIISNSNPSMTFKQLEPIILNV